MKLLGRYSISLSPQQPVEIEPAEVEESEQFLDFAEEPRVYEGYRPEEGLNLVFVDGVRRTECLAYIKDEETGESSEGAFVSLGAGALRVEYGRLNLIKESLIFSEVKRIMAFKGSFLLQSLLNFEAFPVDGDISVKVNKYMRDELEAHIALQAYKKFPKDLIICDGTLSYKLKNTPAIGFVKSIKRLYFDKKYLNLLYSLKPGQRSPIIKIHYQQKQEEKEKVDKLTWYVKLSNHEGLHGIARVEVFPKKDFEKVKRLADLSAGLLPLFASTSFQDRRSPQNLLPIGRLEKFLRSHLGAYGIIRRRIESFLYA
ncbi:MAG: DNA double-strand break repair nuclease NurA [Aquificaceae bacterium]|nr:DNA double-strand break repair nuclease NurA [Aquificaceae bacterium]